MATLNLHSVIGQTCSILEGWKIFLNDYIYVFSFSVIEAMGDYVVDHIMDSSDIFLRFTWLPKFFNIKTFLQADGYLTTYTSFLYSYHKLIAFSSFNFSFSKLNEKVAEMFKYHFVH